MLGVEPCVHLVIPTHTTRYLDVVLASLSLQTACPATVVVTCDTDDAAIGKVLEGVWPRVAERLLARGLAPPRLLHVARPPQGEARLNQVRNNGLRALGEAPDRDLVVLLDGDTLLAEDAVERYLALAAEGAEFVIPFRVNLDATVSATITAAGLLGEGLEGGDAWRRPLGHLATAREYERLEIRERRYLRQLRQRQGLEQRVGLIKSHKPKLLGGHHAVSMGRLRAVNGFDERYTGWGFDDDELSRRLHAMRPAPRTEIAVRSILAFHLWHESRAPRRLSDSPGYQLFNERPFPRRAAIGLDRGGDQPEPRVRAIEPLCAPMGASAK